MENNTIYDVKRLKDVSDFMWYVVEYNLPPLDGYKRRESFWKKKDAVDALNKRIAAINA